MVLGKIDAALELLQEILPRFHRPVVMSSFGKDSMVMLDLVARVGRKLPIVFFREPHCPEKYAFANRVILERSYTVYDYPPFTTMVSQANGVTEIVNFHDGPRGAEPIYLPTGIKPPVPGASFLCGLKDLYEKPLGSFDFPWDLMLVGHKASDEDPILGRIPPSVHLATGPPAVLFPLKDFTDADVWDYTVEYDLPINRLRYDEANGWREFEDVTYNPDYFRACVACMELGAPTVVACPKTGGFVYPAKVRRLGKVNLPAYVEKERVEG